MKYCYRCKTTKSYDLFRKDKNRVDGLNPWCKDWCKIYQIEKRRENLEKILQQERVASTRYYHTKRKLSVTYRISHNLSSVVQFSLKGNKGRKHVEDILGFSVEKDLIPHLQSTWKEGMSWENYGKGPGKWSIDHIKPIVSFTFTSYNDEEFKECWALSNLQALWSLENSSKSGRML